MAFITVFSMYLLSIVASCIVGFFVGKNYGKTIKKVTIPEKKKKVSFPDDKIKEEKVKEEAMFRYFNPYYLDDSNDYKELLMRKYASGITYKPLKSMVENSINRFIENSL